MLAACSLALVCSCDSGNPTGSSTSNNLSILVPEKSYVYVDKNKTKYIISAETGVVSDTTGAQVGLADVSTGLIVDMTGATIAEGVNFQKLDVVDPTIILDNAWLLTVGKEKYIIYTDKYNFSVTTASGEVYGVFVPSAENPAVGNIIAPDGATILVSGVDLSSLTVVSSNVALPPASSSSSIDQLPESSSANNPASSSVQNPASSSSTPSSSSAPASSSSTPASSSANTNGSCPTIKYLGGSSGKGFASRYWDCCKPSCAWNGGNARQCSNKGETIYGDQNSSCNGGSSFACTDQAPFTIEGCDTYGFAFAAVPSRDGGKCGKCFELTPISAKMCWYENGNKVCNSNNNVNKFKLSGRKLIVMANNIGDDVGQGQFDVMIPGGGAGKFNGCSAMGWGSQGETYGGLLSSCQNEYAGSTASWAKCLTERCNKSFANDTKARNGCLFLADFMFAANNPEIEYREVECPEVLKKRY